MKSYKVLYDRETCSRCMGTGFYSRCQTWGTTCFKCGVVPHQPGTGKQLTKNARKAKLVYDEICDALLSWRVSRLEVGMVVRVDSKPALFGIIPGERGGWFKVESIEQSGSCSVSRAPDGTETRRYYTNVKTSRGDVEAFFPESYVRRLPSEYAMELIVRQMRNVKGCKVEVIE